MDNGASSYRHFLEGDQNGIVEIIRDYKDGLIMYLNGIVRNIYLAEELTEETFVKLVVKRPRFSGRSTFKTWLYTLGRNTTMDFLRKKSKLSDMPIEDYENMISEMEGLEKSYIQQERRIVVHRALDKLKTEYSQVLYLMYFEDFNNSQIAIIMKKSKRQIENLAYRARMSIKSELDKEGFVYEDL